jgi:hypothetical protein
MRFCPMGCAVACLAMSVGQNRDQVSCWSAGLARAARCQPCISSCFAAPSVSECCVACASLDGRDYSTVLARGMIRMADCVPMDGGKGPTRPMEIYEYNSH